MLIFSKLSSRSKTQPKSFRLTRARSERRQTFMVSKCQRKKALVGESWGVGTLPSGETVPFDVTHPPWFSLSY